MSLPQIIAPPAPKPAAAAPAPEVTPTPTVTTEVTPTPTPAPNTRVKGEPKESFSDLIGRRFKEAEANANKTADQLAADKAAADKTAADKVAADKKAQSSTQPDADLSDESIQKEIEVKTKGMDGAAKQAWADLRYAERDLRRQLKTAVPTEKVKEYETQINDLRQQLEAAKVASTQPAGDPAEVQAMKDKLAQYEQDLTVAKVERTDAFQNAVTKPMETITKEIERYAKKYELDARELMDALNDTSDQQSDKILEVAKSMNEIDKLRFASNADKIVQINEKATVLRSQAKDALAKIEAKQAGQTQEQVAAAKAAREAAHQKNWEALKAAELKDVLTTVEGDDDVTKAWNQAQTDVEKFAKELNYGALAPDDQAVVNQRAAVYPLLVGVMQSYQKQLADERTAHEATLARLTKFEEKRPGGNNVVEGERRPAQDKETDFVKRIENKIKEAQAAGTMRR